MTGALYGTQLSFSYELHTYLTTSQSSSLTKESLTKILVIYYLSDFELDLPFRQQIGAVFLACQRFNIVDLNLWVLTALGVEQPFHKGHISDTLHIRYLHYDL